MKSLIPLFKEARAGKDSGAQGGSTSDQDFDDAADDALVEEGEALLNEEDGELEEADSDDEEEQSEEDQDEIDEEAEEEEEVESEEEEVAASGFKFKNPETGDFDFKRINKVVGGPELEKAFKEQTATITRTSQENKALKEQLSSPQFVESKNKAGFLDRMMQENPVIQAEVMRVLHGGQPQQQNQPQAGNFEIPGLNPEDPVAPVLRELVTGFQSIQNRLQDGERQRQAQERDQKFVEGLKGARARFKELTGSEITEEQMTLVAQEMQSTNVLNGARFVPDLFADLIQKAAVQKALAARKVKRNLPKTGTTGKVPAGKKAKRSREDEFNDLWEEHMG